MKYNVNSACVCVCVCVCIHGYSSNHIVLHNFALSEMGESWTWLVKMWSLFYYTNTNANALSISIWSSKKKYLFHTQISYFIYFNTILQLTIYLVSYLSHLFIYLLISLSQSLLLSIIFNLSFSLSKLTTTEEKKKQPPP